MTKFKYLLLCILLLALAQQAAADYKFDGTPIVDVTHGTVAGGVYVAGGHGNEDAKSAPYTESFDLPGDVVYARLYVGVWGGTPDYTGTVETTINGESLGTLNLAGKNDANSNVMCTGFGVYLVTDEVTSRLTKGANTVSVTTAGAIDGRVYGITLAAVYENEGAPEVEYWINDGHENLNYKTPHDECTTAFSAATSANSDASLTVGYLCGDPGEKDYLYINDNQIGGDDVADSMRDSAYGFDLKTFDVSSYFNTAGNTILFERGTETAIHPFIAVLTLASGDAPTPTPSPSETKPDLRITEIKVPDRVFAEKNNTIEVVVRNQGNYDVTNAFNLELSVGSILLGSVRIPDLGAGESETVQFIWNPDETIEYRLRAMVDVNSIIDEADETNNEAVSVVTVGESMGYYGDDSIETFEHGTINGSIVYTIGNSSYSDLLSPDDEYAVECNLTLPDNATVRNARLYIYWTWGKDGTEGKDAEMEVNFSDHVISADDRYTDRKGYDPFDYPSGTYCYNVTNYIEDGNGSKINYTTILKHTGSGYAKFAVCGINLLVVYEDLREPEIEYWINEGCDIIYSFDEDDITPEDATTNIYFSGVIDLAEVRRGTLTTFVTGGNEGGNELGFNSEVWDKVYNGDPYDDLAIDERDVTDHLNASGNYATISEINDHGMVPSTAILILERGQKVPKLDRVAVVVGEITDMGIHYISDDTYGAVFGTLRFAIYDRFDRIAGYREAEDIAVYAVPISCDPDYNMWMNVTATSKTRTLKIFDDPYTNETQDYITEICFFDEDDDDFFDDNETEVYRTVTSYDGTFALQLEGGIYDIYARY
jgi:hypothetical protein